MLNLRKAIAPEQVNLRLKKHPNNLNEPIQSNCTKLQNKIEAYAP
jgi:hypothetical protein